MGAPVGSRTGRSQRRKRRAMSEINVTPMVDVMLVLLIIFMVTAPLLTTGVKVDLPRANAQTLPQDNKALTVNIKDNGSLFLQETEIVDSALSPRLQALMEANPEAKIYVRGDGSVPYARVMEVMGLLRIGGFTEVSLITQPPRPATTGQPSP